MKAFTRILLLALFVMPFAATADDTATTKTKLTAAELQVMAHYHAVNLMEIDLGTFAKKRGTTQAIKSYGDMLVKEHRDSDAKLRALAKNTGQMIPREKPATDADKQEAANQKKEAAALKKLTGAAFDREYLRMMVDGHDKELAKIDTNVGEVTHSELADLLRATKPVLQHHADEARSLQKTNASAMR
jgi:putative membrane protein